MQKILLSETEVLIRSKRWKELDQFLPNTIEKGLSMPVISDLILTTSRKEVVTFIEYELVLLSSRISVGGNLTSDMVQFIASELVEAYPNESLADFRLCFVNGAMGKYNATKKDDIFRLDGIVIRQWMELYLEDKAATRERLIDKFKHNKPDTPLTPEEEREFADNAKKYIKQWQEQLGKIETKLPPMTDREIKMFGKKKPKQIQHVNGLTPFQLAMKTEMRALAFKHYKNKKIDFSKFGRFLVNEYEVFAFDEIDAGIFYSEAFETVTKRLNKAK